MGKLSCFISHILHTSGLPVQVRDHALGLKDEMPKSDVNKEYYTQNAEREVSQVIHPEFQFLRGQITGTREQTR